MKKNKVIGDKIIIELDSNVFSKDGIIKCLYWYTNKFRTSIRLNGNCYEIELIPKNDNEVDESELKKYLIKLEQDLVDFNLRDIVSKETKTIRELLIAKAFSNGEYKEKPPGELDER